MLHHAAVTVTLTILGVFVALPGMALSSYPSYHYTTTDETIEKVDTMLQEIENGAHDKKLHRMDKSYEQMRKAYEQYSRYKKALDRLNSNSVKKQQKQKAESVGTYYTHSTKNTKSEQEVRCEESRKKFCAAAADFKKELAPLMETMQISEYTWRHTWGIDCFCKGSKVDDGKEPLFNTEQKTFKEAFVDCLERYSERTKTKKAKADFL